MAQYFSLEAAAPDLRPRRLRLLGALMAALVLAVAMLVGHLYLKGLVSGTQLDFRLSNLARQIELFVHSILGSRGTLGVLAFVTGTVFGGLSAWQWMTARHRQRSLLIGDFRQGDMPFTEGIAHIRRNARPRIYDDATAVRLILKAVGLGRISLWHRAPSNSLLRVSSRHIRLATPQIVDTVSQANALALWNSFLLLRAEVEQRWPSIPDGQILVGTAINTDISRRSRTD